MAVSRQWISKNVHATTNTHATIEEGFHVACAEMFITKLRRDGSVVQLRV
jgi:hypothetical protein